MADNRTTQSAGGGLAAGVGVALLEVTFSGEAGQIAAPAVLALNNGSEGARTLDLVSATVPVPVREPSLQTATLFNRTAATSSTVILASNAARLAWEVENDSDEELFIKRGATASTTSWSIRVPPKGAYRELGGRIWSGELTGIWTAASGVARVTEMTA